MQWDQIHPKGALLLLQLYFHVVFVSKVSSIFTLPYHHHFWKIYVKTQMNAPLKRISTHRWFFFFFSILQPLINPFFLFFSVFISLVLCVYLLDQVKNLWIPTWNGNMLKPCVNYVEKVLHVELIWIFTRLRCTNWKSEKVRN